MKIIKPSAEYWEQKDKDDHVARCGHVCYASDKETDSKKFAERMISSQHLSVFRHVSRYFIVKNTTDSLTTAGILTILGSAYCSYVFYEEYYYISTNSQFVMENPKACSILKEVSYEDMLKYSALCAKIRTILRYTVCLTTQISTSRELNRVSPNNICEQSTRYVNFMRKQGGITICEPEYYQDLSKFKKWTFRTYCKVSEIAYKYFLKTCKPEEARECLPLCTATRVVYTYTYLEWAHIYRLRYLGTTGKPHPNAKEAVRQICLAVPDLRFEVF